MTKKKKKKKPISRPCRRTELGNTATDYSIQSVSTSVSTSDSTGDSLHHKHRIAWGMFFSGTEVVCVILLTLLGILAGLFSWRMWWLIAILVILAVLAGICQLYHIGEKMNYKKAIDVVLKQNTSLQCSITDTLGFTSKTVVSFLEEYKTYLQEKKIEGIVSLLCNHSFGQYAKETCQFIYQTIFTVTSCSNTDVLVTRYVDSKRDSIITETCVYPGTQNRPSHEKKPRKVSSDSTAYRDQRYFDSFNKTGDARILVSATLEKTNKEILNNRDKYEQFMFVPIMKGNSLTGIIEVFVYQGSAIQYNESELYEFAEKFISPYAQMFVLWDNLDRRIREEGVAYGKEITQIQN